MITSWGPMMHPVMPLGHLLCCKYDADQCHQVRVVSSTGAVVTLSAYFAGTTLGIFTLDRVGLQILSQASDDAVERAHASMLTFHAHCNTASTGSFVCKLLLWGKRACMLLTSLCMCRDHIACERAWKLAADHPPHRQHHCQL